VKTCLVACFWLSQDFAAISRNATMTFFMRYGPAPHEKKCHSEHQTLFHFTGRSGDETSFVISIHPNLTYYFINHLLHKPPPSQTNFNTEDIHECQIPTLGDD